MAHKRLDRREQRRAEANVRQAAFDAEVREYARDLHIPAADAREAVRAQHKILHDAAVTP